VKTYRQRVAISSRVAAIAMALVVIMMGALIGAGLKVLPVVVVAGLVMIICLAIMATARRRAETPKEALAHPTVR